MISLALEWIKLIVGGLFLLTGITIFITELFGVFRFDYSLNRMHAAAIGDTLGITSSLIGLMIFSGFNFTTLKMALVIVFLWFASPTASHLLARLEVMTNNRLGEHAKIYFTNSDLEEELEEEEVEIEEELEELREDIES